MYVSALSPPASGGRLPHAPISPGTRVEIGRIVFAGGSIPRFPGDADALLAPFGNRIPAGVKGLDAVLGEYVAFKEADTRRKRAVASNPLAKRMYDVLEECATGATRVPAETSEPVVPASDAAAESRGRARASRETLAPRDARLAANDSRARGCLLYTSPSPRDATLARMPSSA